LDLKSRFGERNSKGKEVPGMKAKRYFLILAAIASVAILATISGCKSPLAAAPAAPTGVVATAGAGQVTISWTAVAAATSYNIYWSTTSGVTTKNGSKISDVTSPYTQTGLTGGTTYYYVVTAVENGSESAASSQVSATPTASTISISVSCTPSSVAMVP
jgi:fibronectin type 3 domain-containing protein